MVWRLFVGGFMKGLRKVFRGYIDCVWKDFEMYLKCALEGSVRPSFNFRDRGSNFLSLNFGIK